MENRESELTAPEAGAEESGSSSGKEEAGRDNRLPRRYRLYDRIKEHVSLRTVDAVIIITSLLIIIFLIIGIVTGNRS